MRAFSSVAISSALNGILLALRIVSIREVAVTICDEPEVRDVYMYSAGSLEYDLGVDSAMLKLFVELLWCLLSRKN